MTRLYRAGSAIGLGAFTLGATLGVRSLWALPVIVAALLLIEYGWSRIKEADQ
ncbi:hypothetical protein SEA_MURP_71 [Gordonia phage Murp]|nr:hypothetical protein SEA_MURP_71 [Gordonia phage Murp]